MGVVHPHGHASMGMHPLYVGTVSITGRSLFGWSVSRYDQTGTGSTMTIRVLAKATSKGGPPHSSLFSPPPSVPPPFFAEFSLMWLQWNARNVKNALMY